MAGLKRDESKVLAECRDCGLLPSFHIDITEFPDSRLHDMFPDFMGILVVQTINEAVYVVVDAQVGIPSVTSLDLHRFPELKAELKSAINLSLLFVEVGICPRCGDSCDIQTDTLRGLKIRLLGD